MSVIVIIGPGDGAAGVVAWGRRFAAARGLALDVVQVCGNPEEKLPELDLGDGDVVRNLGGSDLFHGVVEEVEAKKPELVLLGRQAPGSESEARARLVRRLFAALHCDTMMIRAAAAGAGVGVGECQSVLVPASGGPHSLTALAWARDLVMGDGGGKVVPLFVEPDTGELAEEVGEHRLATILKRAGLSPNAPGVEPRVVIADDVRSGIGKVAAEGKHDLLLVGASGIGALRSLLFGTIPERLFKGDAPMAVAVVRRSATLSERVRRAVERWLHLRIPQLQRSERVSLVENIETNARWSFDFMLLICLSTAIAGLGLMLDSTAVVIGAMLVAPLMTPLVGSGLALVQGNLPLMRSSARAIIYGFFAALVIGMLLGFCSITGGLTSEMESRGGPGLPDMLIALLSGVAASYCIARPNLSSALAGVAIAAALVPPIATVGIAISLGEFGVARGAAILFATNVVAIILGAAATFYATGIRGRRGGKPDTESLQRPVWVRRTILALVLCAVGLAVPLGSVLITKLASTVVVEFQDRSFYRVRDDVKKAMAKSIADSGDGHRLEGITGYREGGVRMLELEVIARAGFDNGFLSGLEARASELAGEETRLRIVTRILTELSVP